MVCGFHSKAFFIFCGVISVASCILSEDVSQASEFYVFQESMLDKTEDLGHIYYDSI